MPPRDFPLRFLAGRNVLAHLQGNGFSVADFPRLLGAAGGPKWLVLHGLDRVLAARLQRSGRHHELLGSSIGAWRFAAYAQRDTGAAVARLRASYTDERIFAGGVDLAAMFQSFCRDLLGREGAAEVVAAPHVSLAVNVTWYDEGRLPVLLRLGFTAAGNLVSRALVERRGAHRLILTTAAQAPAIPWPATRVSLTAERLAPALLASGAVPGMMPPVRDLWPGRAGYGLDGGLLDYHFDDRPAQGCFVLYPHFYPHMVPGWFDKPLRRRWLDPRQIDNMLLVAPSAAFIAQLPDGKLPDRGDPRRFGLRRAHRNWLEVARRAEELGEALELALDNHWIPELAAREAAAGTGS